MFSTIMTLMILLSSPMLLPCGAQPEGTCGDTDRVGNMFTLSVNRRLNHSSGEWYRTFAARKVDMGKSTGLLELEALQGSNECNGKTTTHLQVVVREGPDSGKELCKNDDRLLFHPRHGINVVLLNGRRSAQRLDLDDNVNASLFTHRPLRNNELFEVRLDKRVNKLNNCFGMGVMSHSADDVEIKPAAYLLKNGTWMYYNSGIYGSGRELHKYGPDLNKIQARDRLGVMRRDDGSVHFFMNGVDLGRALQNIPEPIYGVVELSNDAVKGTIVY
ncbi:neuralized-like protein 4 [Ischnura elegans]|uniref:neuralized-like protein 4 n=1 Tax=Ischnura elegans TaxID=197161 RepID=UPI001ED86706|nr:neuralized-like protein 4 [Ischnura elegans]